MGYASPRKISVVASMVVAALATLVVAIIIYASGEGLYWWAYPALAIVTFLASFFVFSYTVEQFLNRPIKLIFRTMQFQKTQKERQFEINMGTDVLGEVESEVTKWAQRKRQEIDKLTEQEEFRREFIGSLTHELKTPVFSIQGYILTLLEGGLEDERINRDYLERASKGVDRVTKLLEDLDTITSIESGSIVLEKQKFDLVALAKDRMEELEISARQFGVTIAFKQEYPAMMVTADRARVGQVFANLLNNAVKYNKKGGKVSLRFYDTPETVQVEIADTGLGIAEEHLPRLFGRFYRVDKSRSREVGGTGLGLSIVKHILEAHGQNITVRSTSGVGSTFTFALPKS